MTIVLKSKSDVDAIIKSSISESDAINEVKSYDRAHGEKLPHKLINQFFNDQAPKFDTLAGVEQALNSLYKRNNIETTTQGVKQVISNYKKKVELTTNKKDPSAVSEAFNSIFNETSLNGKETKKRNELVKELKKHFKIYSKKMPDGSEAMLYTTATAFAKEK
jgi:hypothetical protein